MRKNYTSVSVIKNAPINIVRNRSNSNLNDYKIEKEIKSLPIELRKNLQKVLSKMELSSEVYIPKNLPPNRQFEDKNLLINKIKDYDNFIEEKRKSNSKLSQDNSTFLKVYSHIKELESQNGKINRQQEFFDEIEKLYLSKDYNMNNCRIKEDENIFDYSILIDKKFGNNVKQDAIRILNELDNTDIDLEQKFIFDLNSELYNRKLKNTFRNRYFKSKEKKPKDYGFENIKRSKSKQIVNYIFGVKKKRKNSKKEKKKEKPDYFNNKIKNDISQIKEVIENIKNNYQEKPSMRLMNFLKTNPNSNSYEKNNNNKDRNKRDNLILINIEEGKDHKHFKTENNFIKIPKLKIKNILKENKDNSKNNSSSKDKKDKKDNNNIPKIFNKQKENNKILDLNDEDDINLNQNQNNNENNKKKRKDDELPKINLNNNSIDESKNKNINLTTDTNFSRDINNDNNLKLNIFRLKQNNNKDLNSRNNDNPDRNINSVKKDKPVKLNSIKKLKKRKITYKSIPNLKTFLSGDGDKKILTDKEINLHLLKFKKKHNSILQNLRNSKIKETNLHGFTKNFQNVTKERNFSFVFEKNKFLKNNDFSNLLSHFDDNNDEIDAMNIKEIDKKIMNIHYDMAESLLKNISH